MKIWNYIIKLIKSMNIFYEINNNILNKYDIKNRNYELFQNINDIENNINCKELESIINTSNTLEKFNLLFQIYNKTKKLNEMTIKYNIEGKSAIKLFSQDFVQNNKNNCKLIINGKEEELCDYYLLNNANNEKTLEIKLKEINPITSMYRMFKDCTDLISLPDFSEWDTSNVIDMHSLFNGCSSLSFLSDISKWNTHNVTTIRFMFWNCRSLEKIPDISKWDSNNFNDLYGLFCYSENLKCIPDISKWNTSNVTTMGEMFRMCSSLTSLPDLSKWNTSKVTNMKKLFNGCSSLLKLPDISKWDVSKVINFEGMFEGCNKNLNIPETFKKYL